MCSARCAIQNCLLHNFDKKLGNLVFHTLQDCVHGVSSVADPQKCTEMDLKDAIGRNNLNWIFVVLD